MHISHVYYCTTFRLHIITGLKYPFPILVLKIDQATWSNISKTTSGINIANQLTLKIYEDCIKEMSQWVRFLVVQS